MNKMGTTLVVVKAYSNFKQYLLQIQGVFAPTMTKYLLHGRMCDWQNWWAAPRALIHTPVTIFHVTLVPTMQ